MNVTIHHSLLHDDAEVVIPPSKSLLHRALITAALAEGKSCIQNVSYNQDIEATIRSLQAFGCHFEKKDNDLYVEGTGGHLHYDKKVIDCGESGSTLRFLIPIAALLNEPVTFTGHGRLMQRPQDVYAELFKEKGLLFKQNPDSITVQGPLPSGEYTVRGDVSSQFITGLLLALPLCDGDSHICILPPFESSSYVGLSLEAVHHAGVLAEFQNYDLFIEGNQSYHAFSDRIAGDDSQAAFFTELAGLTHKTITVRNISHHSIQGDHVILSLFEKSGGVVKETEDGYALTGGNMHGIHADLSDCPDLGPALFASASQYEGTSVFTGCERLRIKESDRITCMEEELHKLGCSITSDGGTVTVIGKHGIQDHVVLNGHNDHRIVMALSILALMGNDITMEGAEAVNKSYPDFFRDIERIGVNISYD